MTNKLTIEHDVCGDLNVRTVKKHAKKHGVTAVVVDEEGPGGDNPVYQFTGTRAQLEAFVIEFYDAGDEHSESVEFFLEDAAYDLSDRIDRVVAQEFIFKF